MKCKYRFTVSGRIRLDINTPIPSHGWTVEFETSDGLMMYVSVTVPLPRREDWPVIRKNPAPGIKAEINPNTPHLPWIQKELRALQGLLSLFGLRSVDLENPEIEWIPESEEERAELPLFTFRRKREPLPDDQIPPLSFDLIARAVIASNAAADIEVPLNFFRRGMLDIYDRNYIEAFYDLYFILETLFGQGKYKRDEVYQAFLSSDQLRLCVQGALANPGLTITDDRHNREEFERSYGKMTVEEAVDKIIELRGYLHHHTAKRPNIWHPEDQRQYELDALFLKTVTFNVVFAISEPYLWSEEVVVLYEQLVQKHRLQKGDAS